MPAPTASTTLHTMRSSLVYSQDFVIRPGTPLWRASSYEPGQALAAPLHINFSFPSNEVPYMRFALAGGQAPLYGESTWCCRFLRTAWNKTPAPGSYF
jgi:hypothetical protein